MKSAYTYIIIAVLLAINACNTKKQTFSPGTYYGKLPCADCPAIAVQLQLNEDSTYNFKMLYEDRAAKVTENSGAYSIQNDTTLVLQAQTGGMNKFAISGETLKMLDQSGNAIVSDFSEKYILSKTKPENFSLEGLGATESVDFKATGNEPSWALFIDFDKKMHFKTLASESFELSTPAPLRHKAEDADVTRYRAESEAGVLEVSVYGKACIDDMSGKEFNYAVRVRVKTKSMQDYKEFTGCGQFVGVYRLNTVWELEHVNGESLDKINGKKPNLEFDLAQNKVYGFGGCNRLNGTLKWEGDSLMISQMVTTRMACPNLETESKFLSIISDRFFGMDFLEEKLILKNDRTTLTFKPILNKAKGR